MTVIKNNIKEIINHLEYDLEHSEYLDFDELYDTLLDLNYFDADTIIECVLNNFDNYFNYYLELDDDDILDFFSAYDPDLSCSLSIAYNEGCNFSSLNSKDLMFYFLYDSFSQSDCFSSLQSYINDLDWSGYLYNGEYFSESEIIEILKINLGKAIEVKNHKVYSKSDDSEWVELTDIKYKEDVRE